LLLGLFVILYASANVDKEKFSEFSAAFSEYFKAKDPKILQGGDGVLQGHKKGIPDPVYPPVSQKTLDDISQESTEILKKFIVDETIEVERTEGGLVIRLREKLLFESGKAEVSGPGLGALDSLAQVLSGISQQIAIDGHTDSDPISSFQFESNWHLSVTRAVNVAYELIQRGVPEYNLVVRGYGSLRPVADNTSPEGKSRNRRVEITLKELTAESPTSEGYADTTEIL
jgi:chemotaxis protein MotB